MKKILLAIMAASFAGPAFATPAVDSQHFSAKPQEARIAFPGLRLRNFRAEGRDVVYLQDQKRDWYRAELIGPCTGLPFAQAIGIDTRGASSFDRFSAVVVEGDRCPLLSLTRSEAPPRKKAKKRGA